MSDIYTLPDLPFDPGALEPHISGRIMELHHDKHHAAYVNKTIYEGPSIAVPRVGEQIHHDGHVTHVLSLVWDFSTDDPAQSYVANVSITVANMAYTY